MLKEVLCKSYIKIFLFRKTFEIKEEKWIRRRPIEGVRK